MGRGADADGGRNQSRRSVTMDQEQDSPKPERILVDGPAGADMTVVQSQWTHGDGRTVAVSICEDGEIFEVAASYAGVRTRVVYQGELLTVAVRFYNDVINSVSRAGYVGDAQPVSAIDVAEVVLERRDT